MKHDTNPNVEHPSHYNSLGAVTKSGEHIECIDVVRQMNFNIGNVVKYCWRSDFKGKHLEDLKKARFYLDDEIKRMEEEK
jgi:hypothetical protein